MFDNTEPGTGRQHIFYDFCGRRRRGGRGRIGDRGLWRSGPLPRRRPPFARSTGATTGQAVCRGDDRAQRWVVRVVGAVGELVQRALEGLRPLAYVRAVRVAVPRP